MSDKSMQNFPVKQLLVTPRFRVERIEQTMPTGNRVSRDVIRHPGSVVILPCVDAERVCLIRNFRIAVAQPLIELPAGTLEPDEDVRDCALRELAEETGFTAASMEPLIEFFPAPGILDERMRLFVATDLTAGSPQREPGEQIENLVVTWDDALEMIRSGEIRDAKTLVGLLLYHSGPN